MLLPECYNVLYSLNIEAYSLLITALRSRGTKLTDEENDVLLRLRNILAIPQQRHEAELRKAFNDDLLSDLAVKVNGCDEWTAQRSSRFPQNASSSQGDEKAFKDTIDNLQRLCNRHNSQVDYHQTKKQKLEESNEPAKFEADNDKTDKVVPEIESVEEPQEVITSTQNESTTIVAEPIAIPMSPRKPNSNSTTTALVLACGSQYFVMPLIPMPPAQDNEQSKSQNEEK